MTEWNLYYIMFLHKNEIKTSWKKWLFTWRYFTDICSSLLRGLVAPTESSVNLTNLGVFKHVNFIIAPPLVIKSRCFVSEITIASEMIIFPAILETPQFLYSKNIFNFLAMVFKVVLCICTDKKRLKVL